MKYSVALFALLVSFMVSRAETKIYSVNVGDFNEMTVVDGINVNYRSVPDSVGIVVYECEPERTSMLMFSNDKYRLKIQLSSDVEKPKSLPTITVYSDCLTKVSNWGDSTVIVETVAPGAAFKAKVIGNGILIARNVRATQVDASVETGSGRVFISGKAQSAKLSNTGTGAVEAGSLEAVKVNCKLFGTGSIDCNASENLVVMGASSGSVYYRGTPKVKNRSIGVKVIPMDETEGKADE